MAILTIALTDRQAPGGVLVSLPPPWPAVAGAFLTEAQLRGGSRRTPVEYARILDRFFAAYRNPHQVTPIGVHTFAYGRSPGRAGPAGFDDLRAAGRYLRLLRLRPAPRRD